MMLTVSYLILYFQNTQIHKLTFKIFFPQEGPGYNFVTFAHGSCVTANKCSKCQSNLRAGTEDVSKTQGQAEQQKAPRLG